MVSADARMGDVLIVEIKIVKKFLTVKRVVVCTTLSHFHTVLCGALFQGSFAAESVTHAWGDLAFEMDVSGVMVAVPWH